MSKFKLLGKEIPIEYVEDEHDIAPSFWWQNKRYYLSDFIRTQINSWIRYNVPNYIHGIEWGNCFNPIYIELIGDEAVNVYKEVKEDE